MGKGRFFGRLAAAAAVFILTVGGSGGCGNANDQGISFRALGFFADSEGDVGDAGQSSPLGCSDPLTSAIGLENNMAQGINVERVDLQFRVSGSNLAIPNHSEAVSTRLGPASGQEASEPRSFIEIFVAPANIIQFLNDNRNQLPELPFEMVVLATGVGTSDAGDNFRTNRIGYQISWLGDEFCESGEDDGDGEGDTEGDAE
ncbi:MAG: hypothetical protein ACREQY_00915 [Candidatus Binatia bacterium]